MGFLGRTTTARRPSPGATHVLDSCHHQVIHDALWINLCIESWAISVAIIYLRKHGLSPT